MTRTQFYVIEWLYDVYTHTHARARAREHAWGARGGLRPPLPQPPRR